MMFMKLGRRYVNVEMITDVFVQEAPGEQGELHAEVYLVAPMGERSVSNAPLDVTTRHVHVSGEDAEQLVRYLDDHVIAH